jgi:hypothetical protein
LTGHRFGVAALQTGGYQPVQVHDPIYCLHVELIGRFEHLVLPESRLDIGRDYSIDSWVRGLRERGASRQCRYSESGSECQDRFRPRGRLAPTSVGY